MYVHMYIVLVRGICTYTYTYGIPVHTHSTVCICMYTVDFPAAAGLSIAVHTVHVYASTYASTYTYICEHMHIHIHTGGPLHRGRHDGAQRNGGGAARLHGSQHAGGPGCMCISICMCVYMVDFQHNRLMEAHNI